MANIDNGKQENSILSKYNINEDGSSKASAQNSDNNMLTTNVVSQLLDRAALSSMAGKQFNGERDLYEVFGFTRSLCYQNYYDKYDRQDIAGRIVDAKPNETWRKPPKIKERVEGIREGDNKTQFEKQWEEIEKDRRIRLYNKLNRADRISGIGEFGIILIGVNDGKSLAAEMGQLDGPEDIMYLSPYSQGSTKIDDWEEDPTNPRFGLPKKYKIELRADLNKSNDIDIENVKVHHSRVIHIAEDLDENDVYGRPRLKRVYNLLDSLQKLAGASPENFYQNAKTDLKAQVRDDYELAPEDAEELQKNLQEFIHNFTSLVRTEGVDVEMFERNIADPSNPFDVLMSLMSAATGIPKRILLGSESGQMAANQDERTWLSLIEERRNNFAQQQVLEPLIDRFIDYGALVEPPNGYTISWPDLFQKTEKEHAEIMKLKLEAANALAEGGSNMIVDVDAVLDEIGLPADTSEVDTVDEGNEEVMKQFNQSFPEQH